jgi:hypothetical protein
LAAHSIIGHLLMDVPQAGVVGEVVALEMPTSRTTHFERGRGRAQLQNNIKTKPEQLELRNTYPLIWP